MHKIQFEYLSFFLNWYGTKIKVIYVVFVTCHINFWPLSNFVGASLEVTRTISNNKLYFTWGCSRPEGPETGFLFFFFQWFWHIFKYFNSNHNLPSYSLFSKCFSWLFYLGVHRGTGVFRGFIFHSSSRAWLALALALRLSPFDRKTLKNCASYDQWFLRLYRRKREKKSLIVI